MTKRRRFPKFGEELFLSQNLTRWGKVGLKFYGSPFIGGYLRYLWLKRFLLENELQKKPIRRILDAGCGSGTNAVVLSKVFRGASIEAYDLDNESVRRGRKLVEESGIGNLEFSCADLKEFKAEKSFDFITCIDVLEHIPGNRKVVENLAKVLSPGGIIYIHMPYIDWLDKSIFPNALFRKYKEFEKQEHIGEQLTPNDVISILKDKGCSVLASKKTFKGLGRFGWELDQIARECLPSKFRILSIPVSKAFCKLEVATMGGIGTAGGFFVAAYKGDTIYYKNT